MLQLENKREPIAGYTVTERLGAGGYGEVWKAEAPGGLVKAIKFVYGYLDEDRAAREMKALSRIKQVRHPFLLSLERIEIIDGQLVIVTELADASLKDRFEECRGEGLPGIPREELLVYLRDAADALDYMSENFSLQHLDVKPENLLLVGGRVKVADFGLVKELHDFTGSLMGGLTPLYAPPESFDGRPSRFSDQYSLAIVFQEMLTGTMPFPGTTAAQLAAQHLHSRPRLAALSANDQETLSKALAKRPEDRYESCKALANRLTAPPEKRGEAAGGSAGSEGSPATPLAATSRASQVAAGIAAARQQGDSRPKIRATGIVSQPYLSAGSRGGEKWQRLIPRLPKEEPASRYLPPAELAAEEMWLRPTVIIGAGGLATDVVIAMRRRYHELFGDACALPIVQTLLLDTDAKSMLTKARGDETTALLDHETFPIPLKRPQEYRETSARLLKSMSRRWLYNIPRSLQTEGLRPLGRLALVDHLPQIMKRLQDVLVRATDGEQFEKVRMAAGMNVEPSPRVIVLGAISGGCGGGSLIDLAYAARHVLADLGHPDAEVMGLLSHATCRNPRAADLAAASALAFLIEWRHFSLAHKVYPGERAFGLSGDDHAPFDHTYLFHMGSEIDPRTYNAGVEAMAHRLYLETASAASGYLRHCRGEDAGEKSGLTLRTFGVAQLGSSQAEAIHTLTQMVCANVLKHWLGEAAQDPEVIETNEEESGQAGAVATSSVADEDVDRLTKGLVAGMGIDFESCRTKALGIIAEHAGEAESCLRQLLADRTQISWGAETPEERLRAAMPEIAAGLDDLLAPLSEDVQTRPSRVAATLKSTFTSQAEQDGQALRDWVFELGDMARSRLKASKEAADTLLLKLKQLQEQLEARDREVKRQLAAWGAAPPPAEKEKGLRERMVQFVLLRYETMSLRGVRTYTALLLKQFAPIIELLIETRREVAFLANKFTPDFDELPPEGEVAGTLEQRMPELVGMVDRRLRAEYFRKKRAMFDAASNARQRLPDALMKATEEAIRIIRRQSNSVSQVLEDGLDSADEALRRCLQDAEPHLSALGGNHRLLAIVPSGTDAGTLRHSLSKQLEAPPGMVADNGFDATICHEISGIAPEMVAAAILADRPDYAELAARLFSRSDVDWAMWDG